MVRIKKDSLNDTILKHANPFVSSTHSRGVKVPCDCSQSLFGAPILFIINYPAAASNVMSLHQRSDIRT